MKKIFPLSKVHTLLESGPVIMVSTRSGGRINVMPMSWHTMLDFDPPLIGCVISGDSRTAAMLKASRECVICIPTREIADKALACGEVSGADTDKFARFGLTPVKASAVKAPIVDECYAAIECRLADASMSGKYDLFVLKAVKAWVDASIKHPKTIHHRGGGAFLVAGKAVRLSAAR